MTIKLKMRRWLFAAATLCAAFAAGAEVHEYTLDNGLKLLVKEDHRAPVVVSQVWYKVGSSYEYDGITGISHALEHMMFQGTERHAAGEFSRIIAENGGSQNAFTATDFTAYFQTLEKSRLAVSFELEADRMRNLIVTPEEFEKEIKVVREERRWRTEDEPEAFAYETAMATAFQTSPYRHPTVGWMSDLDAMQAEDLRAWYQRWYAPNNAVLVVAGDVDPETVHQLAQKFFAPLSASDLRAPSARPELPQQGLKRVTVKRPAEVPYLMMLFKTPALTSAVAGPDPIPEWEPYALEVLTGIIDGGSSARFAAKLVRGKEVAAAASADYQLASRLDSVMVFEGTPSQGHDVAALEQAIREELQDLKDHLVDETELERVKAQVISQDVYRKDSAFYQALLLGVFESVGLSWKGVDEYVHKVQAVTAEQVQAVARKYLIDDNLTV
ncbi:MAG: M16 family metallopeptidase, partial [Burkholderiales bacterium]